MIDDCDKRVFFLLPELRRSALWGIAGLLLIASVIFFVQPPQWRGQFERSCAAAVLVFAAIWLSQYLLSRIKVDEDGISKRVLWWWTLWPWEAFEAGRIHQGIAQYGYLFPGLPWWSQRIELSLLSPENSKEIDALIKSIWQPPNAGPLPEQLEINFKWPMSQKLLLSPDRITISKKHHQAEYLWRDVREVVIWRLERGRQDFRELHLQLPDHDFVLRRRLHQGSEVVNWTGASSEEVSRYIMDHTPSERFHDFALTGESSSHSEVEVRKSRIEKELHSLIKSRRSMLVFTIVSIPLVFAVLPWPKNLTGFLYCPIAYAAYRMIQDHVEKLDTQLNNLNNESELFSGNEQ